MAFPFGVVGVRRAPGGRPSRAHERALSILSAFGARVVLALLGTSDLDSSVAVDARQFTMSGFEKLFRNQYFFLRLQRSHGAASTASSLECRLFLIFCSEVFRKQILISMAGDAA